MQARRLRLIPHGMIIHHDEEQQKQMMDAQKAVVKVFTHLTRRERPNDDQTRHHRPAGESNRCQKHQAENILSDWRKVKSD